MAKMTREEAIKHLMNAKPRENKNACQILIRWNNGNKTIGTFRSEMAKKQFLGRYSTQIESNRPTYVDHIMGLDEMNKYLQELAY